MKAKKNSQKLDDRDKSGDTKSNGSLEKSQTLSKTSELAIKFKLEKLESIRMRRTEQLKNRQSSKASINYATYFIWAVIIIITITTYPDTWDDKRVSWKNVWYYGWITAISTGAGVIPFFFFSEPDRFYLGMSNAAAGGMMIAASVSLIQESLALQEPTNEFNLLAAYSMGGLFVGVLFIMLTKRILDSYEDIRVGDIAGTDARKMVLIVFVMTLHSLTEGIGIGVSFGGKSGVMLGHYISLSLAMHNVPEGLAICLVMRARNVRRRRAALWAIFSSIPQPIFAVLSFLFVEKFIVFLPSGLGFAAGAMLYVAVLELLAEAYEEIGLKMTALTSCIAYCVMFFAQSLLKIS